MKLHPTQCSLDVEHTEIYMVVKSKVDCCEDQTVVGGLGTESVEHVYGVQVISVDHNALTCLPGDVVGSPVQSGDRAS